MSMFYFKIKKVADVMIATVTVILISPLLAIVALAIKIEDGGNVLIRQSRTGKYGRPFVCYKFRSMKSDHVRFDKNAPVIQDNNPNLTKVGKFIRKFKIDELPQLFNIIKGDMCIIGHRPFLPVYDCEYENWELVKFTIRPGLTGLSQVRGNGYLSIKERNYYDAYYATHASLFLDIKIFFKTIGVLLVGEKRFLKHVTEEEYAALEKLVEEKYEISDEILSNLGRKTPDENPRSE